MRSMYRLGDYGLVGVLVLFSSCLATAQDLQIHVTYVCGGERLYIENCNIRDTSDTSMCYVGHPDTILPNGLMKYTNESRGTLKKLLPTCKQPSAAEIARAQGFQKKQEDQYQANVKKANEENDAIEARAQQVVTGKKPQTPEERAINRCITSGRLPASCTGNALLGAFGQMLSSVLPSDAAKDPPTGPVMAGVFQGAGNWRLDFIDGGVLVNCSFLSPNQEYYTLDFKNGRTAIVINTRPKPLVLTLRPDGTIIGPGPVIIDGVVASGTSGGGSTPGHTETQQVTTHQEITELDAQKNAGNPNVTNTGGGYDLATTSTKSTYVPGTTAPVQTNFAPRRATCPAINLTSKGAGVGMQTMQTDLLKGMFGGDKGAPTPPGIRMHGIYAASTGFSVQFFPESVIVGCGPDAARAYPYNVVADGATAVIHISAPDHPLALSFKMDGSLDPGASGPYQVHGRTVTGQNDNGDFTFAPLERSCNIGLLMPSKTIPSDGGAVGMTSASSGTAGAATGTAGSTLSTAAAPLGNATLSVISAFPSQPGVPNPLAGHTYVLTRQPYEAALTSAGFQPPAGMSVLKGYLIACANRQPTCQQGTAGANSSTVTGAKADASGKAQLPGLPPGTYYFFCLGAVNKQLYKWAFKVDLKAGSNPVSLDQSNATLVN
jgi:hypothetical protein